MRILRESTLPVLTLWATGTPRGCLIPETNRAASLNLQWWLFVCFLFKRKRNLTWQFQSILPHEFLTSKQSALYPWCAIYMPPRRIYTEKQTPLESILSRIPAILCQIEMVAIQSSLQADKDGGQKQQPRAYQRRACHGCRQRERQRARSGRGGPWWTTVMTSLWETTGAIVWRSVEVQLGVAWAFRNKSGCVFSHQTRTLER